MVNLSDIGAGLAQREATVPALRPDCAKEIIWADPEPRTTEWAVVFIHGFSATKHEVRPLPDLIAKELGANLFFTRLTGHGQDCEALGKARLDDWKVDTSEAFGIGHQIGERLLVIGCSTGCTLSALHLAGGGKADALVQISPNYGLRFWPMQKMLDWPALEPLQSVTVGRDMILKPKSKAHEAYWTMSYPLSAVAVTAEAVKEAENAALTNVRTPSFFAVNPNDKVISPPEAKEAASRWGGPVIYHEIKAGPEDDALGHVMAGDVFSPNQTKPLVRQILDWLEKI